MDLSQELSQNWQRIVRLWTQQLYREFENLCFHYRLSLRKPLVRIESMKSRWGQWDPNTRTITLARELIESYPWDAVLDVFKHEVAHQLVSEYLGLDDPTHGEPFQDMCKRLGISPWAAASEGDLQKPISSWKDRALSLREEKLLKRVEKLMALASSCNENEAILAMQKVRELYSRYNIDRLREAAAPQQVFVVINHKQKRVPQHQSMIASILTSHFFVEVIFSSLFDAEACTSYKVLEIMGSAENVQMAEYVYHFLNGQLPLLWSRYQKESGVTAQSRRSYYLGVLTGFDEKLRRDSVHVSRSGTTWSIAAADMNALVLKADQELRAYVKFRHPRLVTRRWGGKLHDSGSFEQGKREGARLTINKPITRRGSDIRLLK